MVRLGEPGTGYRTREEVESWRDRDPILRFEEVLVSQGTASRDDLEAIHDQVDGEVQAAVVAGRQAPYPDVSEVTDHVYA